jgi:hypothetical protein
MIASKCQIIKKTVKHVPTNFLSMGQSTDVIRMTCRLVLPVYYVGFVKRVIVSVLSLQFMTSPFPRGEADGERN